MYKIVYTNRMKKDVKLMKKRGKDLSKLLEVLTLLTNGESLPAKYKDYQLTGNLYDFRECHLEPDWLLMYQIYDDLLILSATATGSYADLFGKLALFWEKKLVSLRIVIAMHRLNSRFQY